MEPLGYVLEEIAGVFWDVERIYHQCEHQLRCKEWPILFLCEKTLKSLKTLLSVLADTNAEASFAYATIILVSPGSDQETDYVSKKSNRKIIVEYDSIDLK